MVDICTYQAIARKERPDLFITMVQYFMNRDYQDFNYILEALNRVNEAELREITQLVANFPHGQDDMLDTSWLIHAIYHGSFASIKWMLSQQVAVDILDNDGYTPLLSIIESDRPDKYEILKLLIARGAPINQKGINDWTPLHMAAARNDLKALEILINYGADLTIKTAIDNYATPLEEAKILNKLSKTDNCREAIAYLELAEQRQFDNL